MQTELPRDSMYLYDEMEKLRLEIMELNEVINAKDDIIEELKNELIFLKEAFYEE